MANKPLGLARAGAGHDKGTLYLVLERDGRTALLADGRRRKLDRPKRKNRKHVEFLPDSFYTAVSGLLREQMTDAAVRRFLAEAERRQSEAE